MKIKKKISPQERLLKEVVNQILKHPETWDQSRWHGTGSCGTTHCVAGWLQVKSGKPANNSTVRGDAKIALALTGHEANWLFAGTRTLSDIYHFAKSFSRDGFDCYGYDRDGFNRDGFNRAGFDCDGYDRTGFNCDGFNCDGFDRAGFDCDGFDCAGFNCAGFDRAGFDRDGFDRAGYDRTGLILVPFEL